MTLSAFREWFQPVLREFLAERGSSGVLLAGDPLVSELIRYPEQLAGGDGKRVRPYVAWTFYRAAGGPDQPGVLRLLAALELFHAFALVHDDIMDRGQTRHGVPTTHRFMAERLQQEKRTGDTARTGDAQAILLGDLLFQWSQDAFYTTPGIAADARERAAVFFRRMVEEVIVGQMLDVDLTTRNGATAEAINRKMHLKTSSYTFIRPMQMGVALAGPASPEAFAWCEQLGTALGRAFQIQDDLLDLTLPPEKTGKTAFSDLQERQHTFFTQYLLDHGTDAQRAEFQSLFGATLTEADRPRVQALFESSGALAHGIGEIQTSFQEANRLLDTAPFPAAELADIRTLVKELEHRTS